MIKRWMYILRSFLGIILIVFTILAVGSLSWLLEPQTIGAAPAEAPKLVTSDPAPSAGLEAADRFGPMEKLLKAIERTSYKAERRSYENKMMARELIGNVRAIIIVLAITAISFPVSLWIVGTRLLRALGLSTDMAETIIAIEERQAKLSQTLKELQQELELLDFGSVPTVKKLVDSAQEYVDDADRDLTALRNR